MTIQALKDHTYVIKVWQVNTTVSRSSNSWLVTYLVVKIRKHYKQMCVSWKLRCRRFFKALNSPLSTVNFFFLKNREYGTTVNLFRAGCGGGRSALVRRPSQTLTLESVVGLKLLLWHKIISFMKIICKENAVSRCLQLTQTLEAFFAAFL